MLPLKPPYNRLHFINILLSPNFFTFSDTEPFLHPYPIFSALPNLTFLTSETKNSNLTNSFLAHYPQPKMNQKSPKDPKSILILTMKLLYTYFWKRLPVGALIWLAPIWLIWAQIARPTSNHLKSANWSRDPLASPFQRMETNSSLESSSARWNTLCLVSTLTKLFEHFRSLVLR